jgi:hypothetical protein
MLRILAGSDRTRAKAVSFCYCLRDTKAMFRLAILHCVPAPTAIWFSGEGF